MGARVTVVGAAVDSKRHCQSLNGARKPYGSEQVAGEPRFAPPPHHFHRSETALAMQASDRRRFTAPEGASALKYRQDPSPSAHPPSSSRRDGRLAAQVRPICEFPRAPVGPVGSLNADETLYEQSCSLD